MNNPDINRWSGKSAEYVLSTSFHEIRNPVVRLAGYLNVLKSANLSEEKSQHFIDEALSCAVLANDIVESVYQYMNEKRKDQ